MTKCIKNKQTKNHFFAPGQKCAKKLERSLENNLIRNGLMSNDTFKMLYIPVNKISKYLM